MTPKFKQFIKTLENLNKKRSAPGDFIYNLASIANDLDFSHVEWTNFYIYVTLQNKDEFVWQPAGSVKTLGDLPIEELEQLNMELVQPGVDIRQNGFETTLMIKNMENLVINTTNGKFVAKTSNRLPEKASKVES